MTGERRQGALPLQAWPLAYWPDGSLKWSGFAAVASAGADAGPFRVAPPGRAEHGGRHGRHSPAKCDGAIDIDIRSNCNAAFRAPARSTALIDVNDHGRSRSGSRRPSWCARLKDHTDPDVTRRETFREHHQESHRGAVGAGARGGKDRRHAQGREGQSPNGCPSPSDLYFYGGQSAVRMVHTIVFDGDQEKDFIRGLGVVFAVPMREQIHNRHVRFSAEGEGLWSEPLEPLTGARGLATPGAPAGGRGAVPGAGGPPGGEMYSLQLAGKRVPNKDQFNPAGQSLLSNWAVWDSLQAGAVYTPMVSRFTSAPIRRAAGCLPALGSARSGLVFTGDVSGGLGVGGGDGVLAIASGLAGSDERHARRRRFAGLALVARRRRPWICATTTPRITP